MAENATERALVVTTTALRAQRQTNASLITASMVSAAATSVPAHAKHARPRRKAEPEPTASVGKFLQVTIRTTNAIPELAMEPRAARSLKRNWPMVRHAPLPRNAPRVGAWMAFVATLPVRRRASRVPQQRRANQTARVLMSRT
jgi:hypothetical protein